MDSPKGVRFNPNPEEIIDFLKKKRLDPDFSVQFITEINIYKFEPWELPGFSGIQYKNEVRYFYCKRYNYAKSERAHRRTKGGYWKKTGKSHDMKAENSGELIGTKKYLRFHSNSIDSKEANIKWVMHEISVEDRLYKEEFVVCRIERKRNNKRSVSTPDEGESSQKLVSPTRLLPSDHLISRVNHIGENIVTNPQLPPPNHNLISYPGYHIEQNTLTNPQLPPNHNMVSSLGNYIEQTTLSTTQLLPTHNMVPYPGNHIDTLSNTQLLPNHNTVSYPGNHIEQNTLTNPQLPPNHNMVSSLGNYIELTTLSTSQLLPTHNMVPYPGNLIDTLSNTYLLPNHNMVSYPGTHIEQNTLTNPQLPPNHNMVSSLGNYIEQTTLSNTQLLPTHNMVPYPGNHIDTLSNTQLLPNHNLISYPGNHIDTLSNPQLLPNHYLISCSGNHIEQYTNPQLVPYHNMISYPRNHIENTLSNPQLLSNYNMISFPRNHNEDNTFTDLQLPPTSVSQLVPKTYVAVGEFNAGGGYNGLNYASFSTPPSPNYQEMELSYSNSSIDNCDFLNSQFDSEQVNDMVNLQRAFQFENSPEETGQTHTPDFNSSKSDGGTYAEDISDTNTETFYA